MQQLQKPTFVKPVFTKPTIAPLFFDKKANKGIDITGDVNTAEIDERIMVNVVRFKAFHDSLINNINEYNNSISSNIENGVINPLSATIDSTGTKTKEIMEKIKEIEENMPYYSPTQAEDIL
ncbi:hypothetical protein GO685_04400 [Wolbachia endosymbiont of Madathamugadia hiepei]|uniref:hypothetical protein n=1 Tax=Wolbachia endosymbiont of Madathamugadia hiepei TaxID=1241303 RepID=UPI00158BE781|nr:hypothetical protein [Wolbachia endosymbiont of Madathamugadia hiepei]NUX01707.1 hypothetical protein [Wolbachia endosymbiont of Madathamugadia hiepei]